jgi:plasmid stabilization system protein ParE
VRFLSLAKKDLLDIFDYYDKKNKSEYAVTLYNEILDEAEKLGELKELVNTNPVYISTRGNPYYSYLISKRSNYKLIYTQRNNIVYISVIWDCRRNPKALINILEKRG